jgi:hypothetical protein
MNFLELLEEVKLIECEDARKSSDDYLERVFDSKKVSELGPVLEKHFGPPFKPAGIAPSKDAQRYADPYGGIQKEQVLYYIERDNLSSCAMIWPWNSGLMVTLKIAQGTVRK